MEKVKKTFGEFPETVVVLSDKVKFDVEGFAEVHSDIADVLVTIPGYVRVENQEAKSPVKEVIASEEVESEVESEEAVEEETAPKRPAPKKPNKKPAPKKA